MPKAAPPLCHPGKRVALIRDLIEAGSLRAEIPALRFSPAGMTGEGALQAEWRKAWQWHMSCQGRALMSRTGCRVSPGAAKDGQRPVDAKDQDQSGQRRQR